MSTANGPIASTPTISFCKPSPTFIQKIPERATKALLLLERALALDPTYALAHAYAAECHHSLLVRGGLREENRAASIRHAEAAIAHGHGDAPALSFAGFVIAMDKHDRAAAFAAFDAALDVSPSSALTYILGSVILAWAGEAERALEWANRGLRLSPFDPYRASALVASSLGHYHCGQYDEATSAARKAVQATPGFSMCHMTLAAALAKLGRLEEASAAALRAAGITLLFAKPVGCDERLRLAQGGHRAMSNLCLLLGIKQKSVGGRQLQTIL